MTQQFNGKIVFSSGKSGDFDIWTLDLKTEELHQLTTGEDWNDAPRWSPDGRSIAFVSNRSGVPELWLMNEVGGEQRQLTSSGKYHGTPTWSPDGKYLACCANYEDADEIELWKIRADGEGQPELLHASPGLETGPSWSPDGRKIVFSSEPQETGARDLFELNLESQKTTQLTSHKARDYAPSYSPDGSLIAFVSNRAEKGGVKNDSDVWLVSSDGMSEPRRVTKNKGPDLFVSWAPSGEWLIYCAAPSNSNAGRIHMIDLVESKVIKVSIDRTELDSELEAEIKSYGLLPKLIPNFLQRKFASSRYFGAERFPHWKA